MSKRIAVGDWFMVNGHKREHVFLCSHAESGFVTGYLTADVYEAKDCTRLPASPRDLVKCWRLAEKMAKADEANDACERNYCYGYLYGLVTDKRSKTKLKRKSTK